MQSEPIAAPARPPGQLPKPIKDALAKARVSWLKNIEVAELLTRHRALRFEVSQEAPVRPPSEHVGAAILIASGIALVTVTYIRFAGGSVFLFNRKTLRFYRKDRHSWRKKADGRTVRETHVKLKVRHEMHSCYLSDQQS